MTDVPVGQPACYCPRKKTKHSTHVVLSPIPVVFVYTFETARRMAKRNCYHCHFDRWPIETPYFMCCLKRRLVLLA